ncbi:uncharacterized protein Dana_GF19839 [Drosophila ananassae]|uniref:Uncharacterized protein n=1 Tax=Drosophila ananassae TaxID=7217 RepID=B3MEH2_DROAN|nr:uncharacterized protein LOC6502581 [Drosophila ananassae]EDV37592.2 uncharacterized protein Dana_GF19839 [Drosophila ananassae]
MDQRQPNLEDKMEKYWRRMFYLDPKLEPTPLELSELEYFGAFRIINPLDPKRKHWLIYSCLHSEIAENVEKVRRKYGKKNVFEIVRKPVYSGLGFRKIVRDYFVNLRWKANGGFLEAPENSYYNDEKFVKSVNNLLDVEHRRIYDYIMGHLEWFKRYNDQKPPPDVVRFF